MNPEVVSIDVRELAPPAPLQQILAALPRLAEGQVLRVWHRVAPCGLFPDLAPLGFSSRITRDREGFCEFVIWRTGDQRALQQVEALTRTP